MTLREEIYERCIEDEERMGGCTYYINDDVMDNILELVEKKVLDAVKYKDINPNAGEPVVTQHYLNGWMHSLGSAVQAIEKVCKS